jgi:hypothetical protein
LSSFSKPGGSGFFARNPESRVIHHLLDLIPFQCFHFSGICFPHGQQWKSNKNPTKPPPTPLGPNIGIFTSPKAPASRGAVITCFTPRDLWQSDQFFKEKPGKLENFTEEMSKNVSFPGQGHKICWVAVFSTYVLAVAHIYVDPLG